MKDKHSLEVSDQYLRRRSRNMPTRNAVFSGISIGWQTACDFSVMDKGVDFQNILVNLINGDVSSDLG